MKKNIDLVLDKAAKIIGIPDNIKEEYYFYSEKYDNSWWVFSSFGSDLALLRSEKMLIISKEELQKSIESLYVSRNLIIEQAKKIIKAGGNPADVPSWKDAVRRHNITEEELKID